MTEHQAVKNLREYLRIPSVHPNINYDACVDFLKKQAKSLDLPLKTVIVSPKKPVVIITWEGTEPKLPSILLNSHMDVVPVFAEKWSYDPFGAVKDANGNIYARGAQDMKSIGIQHLEAIRRFKTQGIRFKRTIHLSFVPEEEVGGEEGMGKFVKMEDFKRLNVGCAFDEGMPSEDDTYYVFYGERAIWQAHIHCPGTPGHASLMLPDTSGEKVRKVIDAFMDYRQKEKDRLESTPGLTLGDVTTINMTMLMGGVQNNVVPPELTVAFDCRISLDTDFDKFDKWIQEVCKNAGEGVWAEFQQKHCVKAVTKLDSTNPYWVAFKQECDNVGVKLTKAIFPAGIDSRYLRELGIPAFGFSPINNTPMLLHDHDEYINEKIFLVGLDILCKLLPAVANLSN